MSSSSRSINRSVTFSKDVYVRNCLHLSDYTSQELRDSFYDNYDVYDFKCDAKQTAIQEEYEIDTITNCKRGTEQFMSCKSQSRSSKTRQAVKAVLLEQEVWGDDPDFGEMVAATYAEVVQQCADIAHQIGLEDEKEAKHIHDQEVQEEDNSFLPPLSSPLKSQMKEVEDDSHTVESTDEEEEEEEEEEDDSATSSSVPRSKTKKENRFSFGLFNGLRKKSGRRIMVSQ